MPDVRLHVPSQQYFYAVSFHSELGHIISINACYSHLPCPKCFDGVSIQVKSYQPLDVLSLAFDGSVSAGMLSDVWETSHETTPLQEWSAKSNTHSPH